MKTLFALLGGLFLLMSIAYAIGDTQYTVVVDDTGNALVLISMNGSGVVDFSLPDDVNDINVKGALYLIEHETVQLSIGSTKHAIMAYQTNTLTSKEKGEWVFAMDQIKENSSIKVHLPYDTIISKTDPKAFIEIHNFKTMFWEDVSRISTHYSYTVTNMDVPLVIEAPIEEEKGFAFPLYIFIVPIIVVIFAVLVFLLYHNSHHQKKHVIKTLLANEAAIVNVILEENGSIKRNDLERKTQIAKSSLASSLYNLENKHIVQVDRTNVVHFITFTEWFKRL